MPKPLPDHIRAATGDDPDAVRAYLLDATHRVVVTQGLAAASTRHIATEAGVAAGTLYNYFDDRVDLVAAAILRRAHVLAQPIAGLTARVGKYTVKTNLLWFARRADGILDELVPLVAATFAEPELLATLRAQMANDDPAHIATVVVVNYLRAEQNLGRISSNSDPDAAAGTIVSLCHDRAFQRFLSGQPPSSRDGIARQIDFIANALEP
ncbi:MAG: helix-turn-helix domain-containing protein [Aquihabitans sp.]